MTPGKTLGRLYQTVSKFVKKKKKKRIAYLEKIDLCSQKVEKFLVDFMKKVIRFHIYGCLKFID